jgi:hypothetical protein
VPLLPVLLPLLLLLPLRRRRRLMSARFHEIPQHARRGPLTQY